MAQDTTTNKYSLPVDVSLITQIVTDNHSHTGAYSGSIDYAVPLRTPVLAAADGKVTRVQDDSDAYGTTPEFGQQVNYISIQHANNEISEYLHLAKGSATVKPGDSVAQGQIVAKTGLSGWMTAPHLHFMVYCAVDTPKGFRCLHIRF